MNFTDLPLATELQRALSDAGFTSPTPIQEQAIPFVLAGRDVMGAAQTGTGKTGAFVIPLLHKLMPFANNSPSPARHPVRALILTPTRELAMQIDTELKRFSKHCMVRSCLVYGGVDMKKQKQELQGGVEIIVATPGRLLDHLQQKNVALQQCTHLVLDEADRMLDMGFLPDIQAVIAQLPPVRQTLLFSATFAPAIKTLSQQYLNHPQLIEVSTPNATAQTIEQLMYHIPTGKKYLALKHLLTQNIPLPVLVFTNTKIEASQIGRKLIADGFQVGVIHGDKTQADRELTLTEFKASRLDILVATDVAARGLDIAGLPSVVNFDLPFHAEDYVHRIGRTGRAGLTGKAFGLYCDSDALFLQQIKKLIGRDLVPTALAGLTHLTSGDERRHETHAYHRHTTDAPTRHATPHTTQAPRSALRQTLAVDPWFLQPYEPAPKNTTDAKVAASHDVKPTTGRGWGSRRKARAVPALLGLPPQPKE